MSLVVKSKDACGPLSMLCGVLDIVSRKTERSCKKMIRRPAIDYSSRRYNNLPQTNLIKHELEEINLLEKEAKKHRSNIIMIPEIDFAEYFPINDCMGIGLEHIEMCPDKTAIIRVVHDESFSRQYKRRIQRDKRGMEYFKIDNNRFYLKKPDYEITPPNQAEK